MSISSRILDLCCFLHSYIFGFRRARRLHWIKQCLWSIIVVSFDNFLNSITWYLTNFMHVVLCLCLTFLANYYFHVKTYFGTIFLMYIERLIIACSCCLTCYAWRVDWCEFVFFVAALKWQQFFLVRPNCLLQCPVCYVSFFGNIDYYGKSLLMLYFFSS